MNWLWPRHLSQDDRIWIRIVRLAHWCIAGAALSGLVLSFAGLMLAGSRQPVSFVAVGLFWLCLAVFGRGLRYVLVRE